MPITLYDLAGAEADRRFSPFCWRTRMALAHKGFDDVTTVPWHFTEKDKLPTPNDGRVPVICDGGRVVHDSTVIADYLEERYPERPSLFTGGGRGLVRFVQNWTETVVQPGLIGLVVLDIHRHIGPEDQVYFRHSREARLGHSLEKTVEDRTERLPAFRASLEPLRRTVERQDFVSGDAPGYADYVVFGAFQWARAISDFELLAAGDPVRVWRGRILDLFGGLARRAPAYGD
ncbi:MAG TPA: glutathione S-transferase family protein [Stellaceae bacterium]|jgi:glutathione S-transferase|nr:glutathione S-transferase family protein [Stellaceae bacterium]